MELTKKELLTASFAIEREIRRKADRLGIQDDDPYLNGLHELKEKLEKMAERCGG